jgi:hypothetical protein
VGIGVLSVVCCLQVTRYAAVRHVAPLSSLGQVLPKHATAVSMTRPDSH